LPTHQKVFFRALIYSTENKGHIVENMFIRLRRGETRQNFNVWVYGYQQLRRGSGIFVPDAGIVTNHRFLPPPDWRGFEFSAGDSILDVYATMVGTARPKPLVSVQLEVSQEMAKAIKNENSGLHFDWGPDSGRYQKNLKPPPSLKAEK
jgi:hypothetical protein